MKYKCSEITRNKIKTAFLDLCNEKPVNKVFVKEISQRAGISRACFYVYYENIAALIHSISDDILNQLWDISETTPYTASVEDDSVAYIHKMAQFCEDNKSTIIILASDYGNPTFKKEWYEIALKVMQSRFAREQIEITPILEDMMEFIVKRLLDVVTSSINDPYQELHKALAVVEEIIVCVVVKVRYNSLDD